MATAHVHYPYNKNAKMPKKDSLTGDLSETKSPENLQPLLERLGQVLSLVESSKKEIADLQTRISCNQTTQENLHSQLSEAKNENEKLLQEVRELRKARIELQQANGKLQALEKEQKRKDNVYTEKNKALKHVTQKTEEYLQNELKDLEESKTLSAQQETEFRTKSDIESQEKAKLAATLRNLKAEKDKLETELSSTKTRLSKLMSDKLSDNNPDIAELSDENRPTKIAEKYQELYDNEWTHAYEVAEKNFSDKDEKARIKILVRILMDIHEFCEKEFLDQENALVQALYRTNKVVINEPPLSVKSQLKNLKRRVANDGIENITQKFLDGAYKSTRLENFIFEVKEFVHESVTICWFMVLQDPPLAFHIDVRNSEVFDSNIYKAFIVTGTLIDFIVWPPLLLQKDGPVLTKGIVECKKQANDFKSSWTRSHQEPASKRGIPTSSVRLQDKQLRDNRNRLHDSSEENVNTTMSDKRSDDSGTATTEPFRTVIQIQYNSKHHQSHAANVPQDRANSQLQQSTQQVQREARTQFVSDQSSDPHFQLQNTTVVPSRYEVAQQNLDRQSYGQPDRPRSFVRARLRSAQHSSSSSFQRPIFSEDNSKTQQRHLYFDQDRNSHSMFPPNVASLSEYPQHLLPTTEQWNYFLLCMKNGNETVARSNTDALSYNKCKNYYDWMVLKGQSESHA